MATVVADFETGRLTEEGDGDADHPILDETGEIAQPASSALIPTAMARMALEHMQADDEPGRFPAARLEIVLGLARLPLGTIAKLDFPYLELGTNAIQDIKDFHAERSVMTGLPPSYGVEQAYDMEIFARTPLDEHATLG